MFLSRLCAPFLILLAAAALPVSAQEQLPPTPQAIHDVARSFGSIEFGEADSDGRPVLHGEIDGVFYSMVLYGCDAPTGCENVQFYASFVSDDRNTLEFVNDWNRDQRWLTAFLEDDGDVVIALTTNIRHGVLRQNFMDTFDLWVSLMMQFYDHIYEDDIATTPSLK